MEHEGHQEAQRQYLFAPSLGIDVGSTKTAALVADEQGNALGYGLGGPGNHEGVGWEGFKQSIYSAAQNALVQAKLAIPGLKSAGMGLAGYDWDDEYEPHVWRWPKSD